MNYHSSTDLRSRNGRCVILRGIAGVLSCLITWQGQTMVQAEAIEGFTEPYRQIEVAVGEPGVLEQVLVKEGQRVQQGDVLAVLNSDILHASLQIAQERAGFVGAIEAAKAELQLRAERLEQIRILSSRGSASHQELARAEADFKVARARLLLAEEERRLHELEVLRINAQINNRKVISPIDGLVTEIYKEIGESYLANDPRVMTVVQLTHLRAEFSVAPHQAEYFRSGQAVHLTLPDSGERIAAIIETVSPVVDAKSGTVVVAVVIDNPHEEIASGTRVLLDVAAPADTLKTSRPAATSSKANVR